MAKDKLIYASAARKAILKADPKLAYCIDSIPSVDAVEVVHGRWIDAYGIPKSKCENCGVAFSRVMDGDCYYCPNCGAKMDGGNEDG